MELYGEILGNGALVDRWVVDELVSRGGSGAVYRARDDDGAAVAVKVLDAAGARSTSMLRRFEQEVRAITMLDHPGIVSVLATGALYDGRPYVVLEWLGGVDLGDHLAARGALPAHEVIAIGKQVGAALAAAHGAGIVHRDVKAENVIVDEGGGSVRVTLVDFGIAKLLSPAEGDSSVTTTTMLGTPIAMAPEQITSGEVDARTDIYGLGTLLFHMATGRPPFVAAELSALEQLHLQVRAPRASDHASVPDPLDRLIGRCLEKQPRHRFQSVDELLGELDRCGSGASDPTDSLALRVVVVATDPELVESTIDDVLATLDSAGAQIALETTTGLCALWPERGVAARDKAIECARAIASEHVAVSLATGAADTALDAWPAQPNTIVVDAAVVADLAGDIAADPRLTLR